MSESITTTSCSDIGRRSTNEDSCLVMRAEELGGVADAVLVVADGMGGHASGEVASRITIETVKSTFLAESAGTDLNPIETLARALRAANDAVIGEAVASPGLKGMGTTCVAAAIRDGQLFYAHMGDSRAYMIRDGKPIRLTEDHSFVAEKVKTGEITEEDARKSRFRNIITRAIGIDPTANPETGSTDLRPGDVILLCSDGLTGPLSDTVIADIVGMSGDVDEACSSLISSALKNGGSDNITVALALYGNAHRRVNPPSRTKRPMLKYLLIGVLIGMLAGFIPAQKLFKQIMKKPSAVSEKPEVDLSRLRYEDPVTLSETPLRDTVLNVDTKGYVLVMDRAGNLIRVNPVDRVVYPVAKDALPPTAQRSGATLAVDHQGNLYISDSKSKYISKYNHNNRRLGSIGAGKLVDPGLVAVDGDGTIYVIDAGLLKVIQPVKQE